MREKIKLPDSTAVNNINKKLLVAFFVMQPVLELILALFTDEKFQIGGISIATMIRYGMIGVIAFLAVVFNFKRKCVKLFIGLTCLCGVYIVAQYLNVRSFDVVIYENSMNKSIIQLALYISKYFIPIIVLFAVYLLKFGYNDLKWSVLPTVSFISLSMLITNIFGIDSISYSFGKVKHPIANIFSWFDKDFTYTDWRALTSRGMYPSGNELASILVLLLPITVYIALREKKHYSFIALFLQLVAMLMVGTRVSVYGAILLTIVIAAFWIADALFNKKSISKIKCCSLLLVFVLFAGIFFNSPFYCRVNQGEGGSTSYKEPDSDISLEDFLEDEEDLELIPEGEFENMSKEQYLKIQYILNNYNAHSIPYNLVLLVYDYIDHTDFWIDLMENVEFSDRNNARKIKTLILKDIFKNKEGNFEHIVGIGEVPIYPEQDFISQYYYLGIAGMLLLLSPYILIILISIVLFLKNLLKKKFDLQQAVLLSALGFITIVAYMAGHVLDPVYINSFMGLTAGLLLIKIANNKACVEEEVK